jgi:soluble lytic murein transglycosylase-like protein
VFVESAYDPAAIGNSGEIGLMQVLPSTAAMLGFLGSSAQLSDPEMNVRYGVLYLSKAWRMTGGDVCRTVVKYRAGLGESAITTRSAEYCRRVRGHLAQIGSSLATAASLPVGAAGSDAVIPDMPLAKVNVVGKTSVRGPILRGSAFWLAHKARIRSLTDKVHKKWQRLARR